MGNINNFRNKSRDALSVPLLYPKRKVSSLLSISKFDLMCALLDVLDEPDEQVVILEDNLEKVIENTVVVAIIGGVEIKL